MKKEIPTYYYTDPLKDEFSPAQPDPKVIDGNYNYEYDTIWKKAKAVLSRLFIIPITACTLKFKYHQKMVNLDLLKEAKDEGYFIYGNHTCDIGDAMRPSFYSLPKPTSVIVNPSNLSLPVLGPMVPSLGGLPLPGDMAAMKKFIKAIENAVNRKWVVAIYPEAHIWPYYTHIRPFTDVSFHYPVHTNKKCFSMTTTYQKRENSDVVDMVTYVDGPFVPDMSLPPRKRQKKLRDEVYETMVKRSEANNIQLAHYVKKEENPTV